MMSDFEEEPGALYRNSLRSEAVVERASDLLVQYRRSLRDQGEASSLDVEAEDEECMAALVREELIELGCGVDEELDERKSAYVEERFTDFRKTQLLAQLAFVKAVTEVTEPLPGGDINLDSLVTPLQVSSARYGYAWLSLVNEEFPEYAKSPEVVEALDALECEKRGLDSIEQDQIMEDMFTFLSRREVELSLQTLLVLRGLAETLRFQSGDIESLRIKIIQKGLNTPPWHQLLEEYFHRFDNPQRRDERLRITQDIFDLTKVLIDGLRPEDVTQKEGLEARGFLLGASALAVTAIVPVGSQAPHHQHYRLLSSGGTYEKEGPYRRTRGYYVDFDVDESGAIANPEAYAYDEFRNGDDEVVELPHQEDEERHEACLPSEQEVTQITHTLLTQLTAENE